MASDDQRPREAADRAAREQREAASVAEMTASRSPHSREMEKLSIAAPAAGYGGEQGLS
jgi:hypothetical protein